jgi:hypothetical protein
LDDEPVICCKVPRIEIVKRIPLSKLSVVVTSNLEEFLLIWEDEAVCVGDDPTARIAIWMIEHLGRDDVVV